MHGLFKTSFAKSQGIWPSEPPVRLLVDLPYKSGGETLPSFFLLLGSRRQQRQHRSRNILLLVDEVALIRAPVECLPPQL